jgi:hypothetical protein
MYIRLDKNVDTANTVKWYLFVLVCAPVAHFGHVYTLGLVLFVAWDNIRSMNCDLEICTSLTFCEHNVRVK